MVSVRGNQPNNKVTASSSTSTNNKAEVKPININNQVEATNNLAKYYSEISQDWAVGEGLIQNIDYSSKTYASQAKDSATEAKASLDEAKGYTSDAVEEIQNLEQAVLSNISMLEQSASSTVEQGIQNIGETVTEALEDLETASEEILENVENNSRALPMFSPIWSDHILNDVSYLRADTFSWHAGYIYKTAYEILLDEYNNENCVEETENGVTYRRTPSGFKIASVDQNDVILDVYNNTGIAWYYIIDVANMQFKLPRTQWGFVGNRDGVGGQIEAGLPSVVHTHTFSATTSSAGAHTHNITLGYAAGANWGRRGAKWGGDDVTDSNLVTATVDSNGAHTHTVSGTTGGANITSNIYGKSDTVQPPATQMYLYFYIGNYVRPQSEINTGKTLAALANKADIDGGNYVGSGLQTILEKTTLGTQGGTLNGTLNIKQSNTLDYTDTNHTTTSETAGEIYFRDKNDEVTAYVQSYFNQYNNMVLSTSARRSIDGTLKTAQTQLYVDGNGNANFTFPMCTTKATTTSSATTGRVAVVVQNYVSGTSWYRVWSDGWIEQGGQVNVAANTTGTVTLLKTMSTTNYFLTGTNISYYDKDDWSVTPYMKRVSTSQIQLGNVWDAQVTFCWMVCGY